MNEEIKGEDALRKLIEIKDKKIWDMNLEIGKMTSELVNLRGAQGIVRKLAAEKQDYISTVKSLETALANALSEDTDWKKKCQELENEMILIKGITVLNAPEMREAKKKISELEEGLANALAVNESHQKLNGRLQERLTEVEEDNKKLAQQIDDSVNRMRKAGL
jgi:hypothetical protein